MARLFSVAMARRRGSLQVPGPQYKAWMRHMGQQWARARDDLKAMNVSHRQWDSMIDNLKAKLPGAKKTYLDLNAQIRDLESNLGAVQQELYGQ